MPPSEVPGDPSHPPPKPSNHPQIDQTTSVVAPFGSKRRAETMDEGLSETVKRLRQVIEEREEENRRLNNVIHELEIENEGLKEELQEMRKDMGVMRKQFEMLDKRTQCLVGVTQGEKERGEEQTTRSQGVTQVITPSYRDAVLHIPAEKRQEAVSALRMLRPPMTKPPSAAKSQAEVALKLRRVYIVGIAFVRYSTLKDCFRKIGLSLFRIKNIQYIGRYTVELLVEEGYETILKERVGKMGMRVAERYDPCSPSDPQAPEELKQRAREGFAQRMAHFLTSLERRDVLSANNRIAREFFEAFVREKGMEEEVQAKIHGVSTPGVNQKGKGKEVENSVEMDEGSGESDTMDLH
jgi:hypothetical protein